MADAFVEELTEAADNDIFAGADRDDDDLATADRGDDIEVQDASEPQQQEEQEPEAQSTPEEESQPEPEQEEETPEPEADPEPEPEAEPEQPAGKHFIPKSRLDQESRKRRALEQQVRDLQARLSADSPDTGSVPTADPNQLELDFGDTAKDMFDKVLDGDLEDATVLFNKALGQAVQTATKTAQEKTQGALKQEDAMQRFHNRVEELVTEYPILDSTNPDTFDSDLCDRVTIVRDGFIAKGYDLTDALDEAISLVLPQEAAPATESPAPAPKPAPKPVQVEKNLRTARQQPPRLSEAGATVAQHSKPNIFEMDDAMFERVSEDDLARMRGDYVD
ncbi:hypothetical protein [Parendozoicomonas haliclonae]|uniref:Uncharacterized protein n=1 Tax=Parendozoicomonas haliclonae TaxID=1960125 RepID=A0A1X7AEJ0_9GAMM|nr:hypothetical protein [Parendozoicomonas haliclonae]SMA33344.1 hypothetical protein EHSB41UT_00265 [Parendozoicomonas haliclonae]